VPPLLAFATILPVHMQIPGAFTGAPDPLSVVGKALWHGLLCGVRPVAVTGRTSACQLANRFSPLKDTVPRKEEKIRFTRRIRDLCIPTAVYHRLVFALLPRDRCKDELPVTMRE